MPGDLPLLVDGVGAATTEIWITAAEPLDSLVFGIRSPAPGNVVVLRLGPLHETVTLANGEDALVELAPRRETKVWYQYGKKVHAYRLLVSPRTGRNPRRPNGDWILPQFYVGAELTYLGTRKQLTRNVYYRLDWAELDLPASMTTGQRLEATVAVQNRGPEAWPVTGVLPVKLTHRWLDLDGRNVGEAGTTALPRQVTPGSWSQTTLELRAPDQEGAYILEIDVMRAGLVQFSELGAPVLRRQVDVVLSR